MKKTVLYLMAALFLLTVACKTEGSGSAKEQEENVIKDYVQRPKNQALEVKDRLEAAQNEAKKKLADATEDSQ